MTTNQYQDGVRKVGVLLEEGVRGGPSPFLKVLEISDIDGKRSTRELLPYLPGIRALFSPLPTEASQVKSGVTQVLLDDVECVTQTLIKVRGPIWFIKIPKGNAYTSHNIYRLTCDRY